MREIYILFDCGNKFSRGLNVGSRFCKRHYVFIDPKELVKYSVYVLPKSVLVVNR